MNIMLFSTNIIIRTDMTNFLGTMRCTYCVDTWTLVYIRDASAQHN